MSSKSFNIIQRLRTKSFSSEKGYYAPQTPLGYRYVENFDNVTEEDCIKFDNQNKEIYKRNMELYEQITKKIENKNALFKIDGPPTLPDVPNNYEKYIKHKLRNSLKNVRYQSYAVQYLLNKNYKIIYNNFDKKGELDFEAYEAINLVEKIENNTIDNILRIIESSDINTNSPQTDRKSIHSVNIPPSYQQQYYNYPSTPQYNSYPSLYPIPASNNQHSSTPCNYSPYISPYNLSTSAPQLSPDSNQNESEQKKHTVSGPPGLHYIPK